MGILLRGSYETDHGRRQLWFQLPKPLKSCILLNFESKPYAALWFWLYVALGFFQLTATVIDPKGRSK